MKIAVSIPDALFEQAELAAQRQNVSRSHFYALALAELLSRPIDDDVTERLNQVYDEQDSRLDPALAAAQATAIADEW